MLKNSFLVNKNLQFYRKKGKMNYLLKDMDGQLMMKIKKIILIASRFKRSQQL